MGLCMVAFALSLTSDRIKDLVETASAFGSAGVFVVTVFALFTPFGGPHAAFAGMVIGMSVWLAAKYVVGSEIPYLMALVTSLAAYVLVALAEHRFAAPAASGRTVD